MLRVRVRAGSGTGAAFFGRLQRGVPKIGVIELPGGFIAGTYANGDIVPASEIQPRDDAFRAAAEASRFVANFYLRHANFASSEFYLKKAQVLDGQIE